MVNSIGDAGVPYWQDDTTKATTSEQKSWPDPVQNLIELIIATLPSLSCLGIVPKQDISWQDSYDGAAVR